MGISAAVAIQAERLAQQGAVGEAFALLRQACALGDAEAASKLAGWRLSGAIIRRDLGEARDYFGLAAKYGLSEAEPIYIALLANGAGGCDRAWGQALERLHDRAKLDPDCAEQLALLCSMGLDPTGEPLVAFTRGTLHRDPLIERLPGFLTREEASYLIRIAQPNLQPAVVVHPQTGALISDPVRTASSAAFPFVSENPVLHAINRRIAAATGTTYEQGEPLQILSYEPGQEYKLHSDALLPGSNQRMATFLVALNTEFEGGATAFPRLGLELRGQSGDALHFINVDQSGRPEPAAWHAGLPVLRGRKLLLSKWIREKPLDLAGPPGRPF